MVNEIVQLSAWLKLSLNRMHSVRYRLQSLLGDKLARINTDTIRTVLNSYKRILKIVDEFLLTSSQLT